jgi:hypothetical protein
MVYIILDCLNIVSSYQSNLLFARREPLFSYFLFPSPQAQKTVIQELKTKLEIESSNSLQNLPIRTNKNTQDFMGTM